MKRYLPWLLALSIFLLSGCTETYPPPAPRSLYDINHTATDDGQLAIGVSPDGTKHILRAVCPTDGYGANCKMTYESTRVGEIGVLWYFYPPNNYSLKYPAITVTGAGIAYMIWQACPNDTSKSRQCATMYARSDEMLEKLMDFGTFSLGYPLAVSRGDTVYGVHEVASYDDPNGSGLRYCNITNPTYTCYRVSSPPGDGVRRTDAAAAVSPAGSLHVIWLEGSGSTKVAYFNDNAGALTGDMTHLANLGSGNFRKPALAIETDGDYLYAALATDELTSDTLTLHYWNPASLSGSYGNKTVNLPAGQHWYIYDDLSLTANNSQAYFGFSAKNDNHLSQSEVYTGTTSPTYTASVSIPYSTSADDCNPSVQYVSGLTTVAWQTCGMDTVRGDVYFYYPRTDVNHLIHASPSENGRGDLQVAANGEWVAGIWNEKRSDGRIETWLAFNAKMTYVPVVRK